VGDGIRTHVWSSNGEGRKGSQRFSSTENLLFYLSSSNPCFNHEALSHSIKRLKGKGDKLDASIANLADTHESTTTGHRLIPVVEENTVPPLYQVPRMAFSVTLSLHKLI
jgi:hypothetical protein